MSTPERPSLADTIARIDAALAEPEPPLIIEGPMPHCDISQLNVLVREPAPPAPDWVTFEKPGHLPGPPGPTCPGCEADAARPGWLARALRRLFT